MIYYFGDSHIEHANVIKHDNRPFSTVEEMNETLLNNYCSRVTNNDTVVFGGDVFFRNQTSPEYYLKQFKGTKLLARGNHDKKWLKDKSLWKYFDEIGDILTVKDGKETVIVCHYPLSEWDGYFRGYYHVYNHIHNNTNQAYYDMKNKERALNGGCMINNYMPVTLEELIVNNKIFKETH